MEKGIEGMDYVTTECAHCGGTGKCQCCSCLEPMSRTRAAEQQDADIEAWYQYLANKQGISVACSVCKGVGKVVFWRPQGP